MRSRKVHLQGTHTRKNRCYTTIYITFSSDFIYFLLAAFFEFFFPFFAVVLLGAFFAAGAALVAGLDDIVEAALVAVEDFDLVAALLDFFAPPVAFFFVDVAFFFGLLALPADFALAVPAVLAFFALAGAFFLLAVAAGAVAAAVEVGAVVFAVVELLEAAAAAAAVVAVVATFFADAFLAGEAERFRFVPVADFGLLDDELAFVVFAALGVFERLRDFVVEDFFVVDVFFFPAAEPFFAVPADECNLKLPVAPTPFVCFIDLFPVPVRKADLRCLLAVVELTLKLAKIYFKIAAFEAPRRSFSCVRACLIISEYFG
jgi:hypothetical protein